MLTKYTSDYFNAFKVGEDVERKDIIETFNKIKPQKRGKILNSKKDILNFMINDIKNGDYLMIKGSNSTGLNKISQSLKVGKINAF